MKMILCFTLEKIRKILRSLSKHFFLKAITKHKYNDNFVFSTIKKGVPKLIKLKNSTAYLFVLDMHPDLGDPIEQIGIEMESAEDDDSVVDFKKKFSEKLLTQAGVNVTELEESKELNQEKHQTLFKRKSQTVSNYQEHA